MEPVERRLEIELVGAEPWPLPLAAERQHAAHAAQAERQPLPGPELTVERRDVEREARLVVTRLERPALDLDVGELRRRGLRGGGRRRGRLRRCLCSGGLGLGRRPPSQPVDDRGQVVIGAAADGVDVQARQHDRAPPPERHAERDRDVPDRHERLAAGRAGHGHVLEHHPRQPGAAALDRDHPAQLRRPPLGHHPRHQRPDGERVDRDQQQQHRAADAQPAVRLGPGERPGHDPARARPRRHPGSGRHGRGKHGPRILAGSGIAKGTRKTPDRSENQRPGPSVKG